MENYQEFFDFLVNSGQHFFIEAEGKNDRIQNFITQHNSTYSRSVTTSSRGICVLGDVDKWGLELRIYFTNKNGLPDGWHVQNNSIFRNQEYPYRLDNKDLVEYLFSQGCVLGDN